MITITITTYYLLPITITDHSSPITNYRLPNINNDYELITDHGLLTTDTMTKYYSPINDH